MGSKPQAESESVWDWSVTITLVSALRSASRVQKYHKKKKKSTVLVTQASYQTGKERVSKKRGMAWSGEELGSHGE